jgi:hypothetical protein
MIVLVSKAVTAAPSLGPVHDERTKFTFLFERFVTRYTKDCVVYRMGGEI